MTKDEEDRGRDRQAAGSGAAIDVASSFIDDGDNGLTYGCPQTPLCASMLPESIFGRAKEQAASSGLRQKDAKNLRERDR
jgi:hypothetical protein